MARIGQPPKLTPALQQAIVNAVAAGVAPSTAGELAGLSSATVSLWMQRGAGTHPTLKPTPLYVAFFEAIRRAQAADMTRRISRLEIAGRGGAVVYRETVTNRDGGTTVRERFEPPNIQADMFHLERRYYEQWGRKDRVDLRATIDITARQIAEELGIPVEDLLAEAQARLTQGGAANKVAEMDDVSVDFTTSLEVLTLASLRAHPRNDGRHPVEEIAHLKASLTAHGVYRNVVVAADGTLLAGHGVVEAARQLGWTTLPGYRMPYAADDPRALQLLVGDNHIAGLRIQDDAMLAALLQDLAQADPLALLGTGYDADTLAVLLETQGLGGEDGGAPPITEPEEPWDRLASVLERWQVQDGDLWQLGRHRIIHGSCLDEAVFARVMDGQIPSMIFADPPYGVSIVATNGFVGGGEAYDIPFGGVKNRPRHTPVGGGQRHKDLTGQYPIETWGKPVRGTDGTAKPFGSRTRRGTVGAPGNPASAPLKQDNRHGIPIAVGKYAPVIGDDSPATAIHAAQHYLARYPDAVHVWWGGNYYADALPASPCWLVWDKETTGNFADCELAWTNQDKAARLFHHRWNGMLRASEHERRWHPTQKPAALAAWVYETLGAPGDLIFDPFLGSGPSLLAAEQTHRTVYGCELSPEYLSIILERWHTLTGEIPTRIEG